MTLSAPFNDEAWIETASIVDQRSGHSSLRGNFSMDNSTLIRSKITTAVCSLGDERRKHYLNCSRECDYRSPGQHSKISIEIQNE